MRIGGEELLASNINNPLEIVNCEKEKENREIAGVGIGVDRFRGFVFKVDKIILCLFLVENKH